MAFNLIDVLKVFSEMFGYPDISLFSPGRANIIGEHTDYTNGFVLPFATGQGIYFVAKKTPDKVFNVHSLESGTTEVFDVQSDTCNKNSGWAIFVEQVLQRINYKTLPHGLNIVLGGNLPLGAGMSSSSSLTCGLLSLFNSYFNLNYSRHELISLAVESEHGTGVKGGMMDQYTIFNGVKNNALLLDCATVTHEFVNVDLNEFGFYLINTHVKHSLSASPYNERRSESEQALRIIREMEKDEALEYTSLYNYSNLNKQLEPTLFKRARHVFSENQRVKRMKSAMNSKNITQMGLLLTESHESLSEDYRVSCEELDFLIETSKNIPGWMGGRMMGGGFGGCTINIIKKDDVENYFYKLDKAYTSEFDIKASLIPVIPSDGLHMIPI